MFSMGECGVIRRGSGSMEKEVKNNIYDCVQCEKRNTTRSVSNKGVKNGLVPWENGLKMIGTTMIKAKRII